MIDCAAPALCRGCHVLPNKNGHATGNVSRAVAVGVTVAIGLLARLGWAVGKHSTAPRPPEHGSLRIAIPGLRGRRVAFDVQGCNRTVLSCEGLGSDWERAKGYRCPRLSACYYRRGRAGCAEHGHTPAFCCFSVRMRAPLSCRVLPKIPLL